MRPSRPIPREVRDAIVIAYRARVSMRALTATLRMAPGRIYAVLREENVTLRGAPCESRRRGRRYAVTPTGEARIVALYAKHRSYRAVALAAFVSHSTVRRVVLAHRGDVTVETVAE